jgi:hypothetical protein
MNADDKAKQTLSEAGAMCGNCGDEPGNRNCPDCERCLGRYVAALRKTGWAPRGKVLLEAADLITEAQAGIEASEIEKFGELDHETELQRDAVHSMAAHLRVKAKESRS